MKWCWKSVWVLQSRFAIVRESSFSWDEDILNDFMLSCIIMHYMIMEDQRDTYTHSMHILRCSLQARVTMTTNLNIIMIRSYILTFAWRIKTHAAEDQHVHQSLKRDLIASRWRDDNSSAFFMYFLPNLVITYRTNVAYN